ncbi:MAG: hypothetical protein HY517_02055 [Candidatus Aenigmarchaeota archaeon]|nr:hypothetical protein [Candidatus Aenigmarchaeota archaeon]
MLHLTAGIFGSGAQELAKKLGKAGTINDLAIYNHGSSEGVFTYVCVNSDKIQTLMQAVSMIDIPVLAISELTASVGEQIVAIAEFGFDKGFILLDGLSEEQIAPLVKGTCIEKFSVVKDSVSLVEEMKKIHIERGGELMIPIDNYFNVKSVGTVALGLVKSGGLKKYDKVMIEPIGKEAVIKGIQSQDKDLDQTEPGMRVGLNLKGIEADELKRGCIVCNAARKSRSLKLKFQKSRYSREQLRENDPIFFSAGLFVTAAKVKSAGETLELDCEHEICLTEKLLIATTKQNLPRIIGHGTPD